MVLQCNLGTTLIQTRGMIAAAHAALTRALTLAREFADFDFQQRVTHHLWSFTYRAAAFHDALAIARQYDKGSDVRDPQSRAVADYLVGIPLIFLGAHTEATTRLRRAIDQYPYECRNRDAIRFGTDMPSAASGLLAVALLSRGLLDAASRAVINSIEEARSTSNPLALCGALAFASGCIFLSLDEQELAERYGEELFERAHKLGLRPLHAVGLCVRGSLAARRGDPTVGVELLRRGLAEMRELSYLLYYPYFVPELARALGATGHIDEGLISIDTALRVAAETGHRWFTPELSRVKGELLAFREPDESAVVDLFYGVMSETRQEHALYWELSAAITLAEFLRSHHKVAEARSVLAPVYNSFTEGFSVARLRHAKALLDKLG
jgi:non-specific serine/threonine protein kinase